MEVFCHPSLCFQLLSWGLHCYFCYILISLLSCTIVLTIETRSTKFLSQLHQVLCYIDPLTFSTSELWLIWFRYSNYVISYISLMSDHLWMLIVPSPFSWTFSFTCSSIFTVSVLHFYPFSRWSIYFYLFFYWDPFASFIGIFLPMIK